MNNNIRAFIIGGFIVGIGTAIGYTAYYTFKQMEKAELEQLPFSEVEDDSIG